jgi:hypothetical protein
MRSHPIPSLRLRAVIAETWGHSGGASRLRRAADALKNLQESGDRAEKLLHEMALLRLKIEAGSNGRQGMAS